MTIILVTILGMLCAAFLVALGEAPASTKARICLISGMTLGACLLAALASPGGIIGGGLAGIIIFWAGTFSQATCPGTEPSASQHPLSHPQQKRGVVSRPLPFAQSLIIKYYANQTIIFCFAFKRRPCPTLSIGNKSWPN